MSLDMRASPHRGEKSQPVASSKPTSSPETTPAATPARRARRSRKRGTAYVVNTWRRVGVLERDGYQRQRGVGQPRKGQPEGVVVDCVDVTLIVRDLSRARDTLITARSMPAGVDRRELQRSALGVLEHASRALDAIVIRRGGRLT